MATAAPIPTTQAFPRVPTGVLSDGRWQVAVDGVEVGLSNLDKVFWSPEGYTKGDVAAYYYSAAEHVLPYVQGRPLTLKRMPEGADGPFFYAKQAPPGTPDWLRRARIVGADEPAAEGAKDYLIAEDTASLLALVNLGCIELHPWHSRVDAIGRPDYAFFDLDPFEVDFATVRAVALLVRTALDELGLRSYPRTSGATGIQIYVPIDRVHGFGQVREWVGRVCRLVNRADPERTTMQWAIAERSGKVFLDHNMNAEGKNIAAVFSLRPERAAPVSMPLRWEEVAEAVEPTDFTIATVWPELAARDGLFRPVLAGGQDLRAAMAAVGMDPEAPPDPPRHEVRADSGGGAVSAVSGEGGSGGAGGAVDGGGAVSAVSGEGGSGGAGGSLRPMLATLAPAAFDDPNWLFEVKWDGVRALAILAPSAPPRLVSRNGNEIAAAYPELAELGEHVAAEAAVLDGELVAFGPEGLPSFQRLQQRMHLRDPRAAAELRRRVPVTYVVFDLLSVDGQPLVDLPLRERLGRLDTVLRPGGPVQRSETVAGDGRALYEAAAARGLEGVVAKRADSRYEPGRRSRAWLKIKVRRSATVHIGGWLPGSGARQGRLGSLLVGAPRDGGGLRYLGRVGTGFDEAELARLGALLAERATEQCPFVGEPAPPAQGRWVRPDLVCAVEYSEQTEGGLLRAAAYKGLQAADASPA